VNRVEDVDESVATRYNGTLFRSRLEARYAVFFDAAGIDWQYEPVPPLVLKRTRRRGDSFWYLPDFVLPQTNTVCDVKGFLAPDGLQRLLAVARAIPHGLTVLGHLPSVWQSRWPCSIIKRKGELVAVPWTPYPAPSRRRVVYEEHITARLLLEGFPVTIPEWAEVPLVRARYFYFPKTTGPIHPRQTYS
jgi:hypothetical protein